MWEFLKNYFPNVVADPASSLKGLISIAVGVLVALLTSNGVIPAGLGYPVAVKCVADGLHALGTNVLPSQIEALVEKELPAVEKDVEPAVTSALETYQQMAADAETHKQKLNEFHAVTTALGAAIREAELSHSVVNRQPS